MPDRRLENIIQSWITSTERFVFCYHNEITGSQKHIILGSEEQCFRCSRKPIRKDSLSSMRDSPVQTPVHHHWPLERSHLFLQMMPVRRLSTDQLWPLNATECECQIEIPGTNCWMSIGPFPGLIFPLSTIFFSKNPPQNHVCVSKDHSGFKH